ncbi:MAG: VIT1/CCC1 transporter family protein [Candidatus Peribacteraceae bacterium]|jgi:VIT1/CCC1 family predicted Fe2+/Mn2+ transporter
MMNHPDIKNRLAQHRAQEIHGSALGPFIHDIVFGAHDGIVTTFAVVAGTVGAELPVSVIVILGVANLLADGVSMGAGAYLSIKAEKDQYERILKEELQEIEHVPEMEREEIREVFEAKGFTGADLDRAVQIITGDKNMWAKTMMHEEHGLTGETTSRPFLHALATFLGFGFFGAVPLLPYLFGVGGEHQFLVAVLSTAVALLFVGVTRSIVTRERVVRGVVEVLAVGTVATSVAYITGTLLRGVLE